MRAQLGVARYIAYVRAVVGGKARDAYVAVCDALDAAGSGGAKKAPVDFVGAITGLFREFAMAAEQDEKVRLRFVEGAPCLRCNALLFNHAVNIPQSQELSATFGPAAVADVALAVQGECDGQGLRLLQRFLEERRVAAVASEAARHQGSSCSRSGDGPDPRYDRAQRSAPLAPP